MNRQKSLLLVLRGRELSDFLLIRLAKQVAKEKNLKIYTCLSEKKNLKLKILKKKYIKKIFKTFSYSPLFFLQNFTILLQTVILFIKNCLLLYKNGFDWFRFNLKIDNLVVGDLFIDTYNRYNLRFLKKKKSIFAFRILFKLIFKTLYLSKIFSKYYVNTVISHHSGYSNNGSIACKIGAQKNLLVLEPLGNFYVSHNKSTMNSGILNLQSNAHFWKKLTEYKSNDKKNKISIFFKKRLENKVHTNYTSIRDLKNSTSGKKTNIKFINNFKIKEKIKKIILIAPHAFSDAYHVEGKALFLDYYEHLKETLIFINKKKIEDVLWVVRPHPTSAYYNEQGIVETLVNTINDPRIVICPKNISSRDIINLSDAVITSRGTIGMEAAGCGKFVINEGSSVFAGLGFSLDPKNKKEYFNSINNINKIKKLKKQEIFIAQCALYYLENDCLLTRYRLLNKIKIKKYKKKSFQLN